MSFLWSTLACLLKAWIAKRNNYTGDTIQNEILQMLAHDIQRQIVSDIDKSPYIGIIADSTTDEDGMEQFSISARYIDVSTFAVHDAFLGMLSLACTIRKAPLLMH